MSLPPPRNLPLVDTHAHLNLADFSDDFADVVARSRAGIFPAVRGRQVADPIFRPFVAAALCPGVDLDSSRRAVELAENFDFLFAAVGVHPNYTAKIAPGDWDELERLALSASTPDGPLFGKIVALGETGLDRYWDDAPFDLQRESFLRHLELGRRTNLPVSIHCRDANDDLDAVLRDFFGAESTRPANSANSASAPFPTGVVHSFSGTPEQAETWIALGFYLGFGGFVTYTSKKFADIWEAARRVPADRILLETDCPFLTPSPLRGKLERNEPLTTAFVARRLAELRDVSVDEIVRQTTENAVRLFRLPKSVETATPQSGEPNASRK